MNTLNVKALSLSLGVVCAICVFFLGITAMYGWGDALVVALNSFYLGYNASLVGAMIGAIWAFVDGVIVGILIGYFYKYFCRRCGHIRKAETSTRAKRRKK